LQAEPSPSQATRLPRGAPVTGVHVPALPETSQASHWPGQAPSQHTPSTQKPEAQAPPLEQASASVRFALQVPASQNEPVTQSLSSPQSPRQPLAAHMNGAHERVVGAGHEPLPSQNAATVAVPSVQLPSRQTEAASG
jgi:hypothetical protein